jgi:hypothetical protein
MLVALDGRPHQLVAPGGQLLQLVLIRRARTGADRGPVRLDPGARLGGLCEGPLLIVEQHAGLGVNIKRGAFEPL